MLLGARLRSVTVAVSCLAAASAAASADAGPRAAPLRPIVYVNGYATYSIRPDGTHWKQLNECYLGPLATNGRQIVGAFSGARLSPALALVPAQAELVNDCDNGPRDPSVLRYRLRPRGTQPSYWNTLAWARDGRRILGVGPFGTGGDQRGRIVVFDANGMGYRILDTSGLDGVRSSVTGAAWSAGGDRIVVGRVFKSSDCPEFVETKTVGAGCDRSELAVMHADGSGARSLYRPPQIEGSQVDDLPEGSGLHKLPSPIFTPFAWHGNRIYVTDGDQRNGTRIAVVGNDGTGFRYLTGRGSLSGSPALSPDGRHVALVWLPGCVTGSETTCGKSPSLYVMSSAGGPLRTVRVRQPLTSATCSRGSLPGRRTCIRTNIGFDRVAW